MGLCNYASTVVTGTGPARARTKLKTRHSDSYVFLLRVLSSRDFDSGCLFPPQLSLPVVSDGGTTPEARGTEARPRRLRGGRPGFGNRAALLPNFPVPKPGVHDDFGYRLAAARSRTAVVANPTHPMVVDFESKSGRNQKPTVHADVLRRHGLSYGLRPGDLKIPLDRCVALYGRHVRRDLLDAARLAASGMGRAGWLAVLDAARYFRLLDEQLLWRGANPPPAGRWSSAPCPE